MQARNGFGLLLLSFGNHQSLGHYALVDS